MTVRNCPPPGTATCGPTHRRAGFAGDGSGAADSHAENSRATNRRGKHTREGGRVLVGIFQTLVCAPASSTSGEDEAARCHQRPRPRSITTKRSTFAVHRHNQDCSGTPVEVQPGCGFRASGALLEALSHRVIRASFDFLHTPKDYNPGQKGKDRSDAVSPRQVAARPPPHFLQRSAFPL